MMALKCARHRSSELLLSVTRLPSWSLRKEVPVLEPSDIRLIPWKKFRASFVMSCISISAHSAFTNSCFFLRNKRRSSILFLWYFSQTARVAADINVALCASFYSIASGRHSSSNHVDVSCLRYPTFFPGAVCKECPLLSLRIYVGIWRTIVKEFRKTSGERFSNLLWSQLLDIKPALHWFTWVFVCAKTCE